MLIFLTPLLLALVSLAIVAILEGLQDMIRERRTMDKEPEDKEAVPPNTASLES